MLHLTPPALVATGGTRHPSAADWAPGLLAFGAGPNIALWDPQAENGEGVSRLLSGHTGDVNAVRVYDSGAVEDEGKGKGRRVVLSGGADGGVGVWGGGPTELEGWGALWASRPGEGRAVNAIATLAGEGVFAAARADGRVEVWGVGDGVGEGQVRLRSSLQLKAGFIPLACALVRLEGGAVAMAVAGTAAVVRVFACVGGQQAGGGEWVLQAELVGHEGWVRGVDFVEVEGGDVLLASGSQDKYIRLWRFGRGQKGVNGEGVGAADPAAGVVKKSLSNKAHEVGAEGAKYSVTFEALLIGHEDWIYTVRWAPRTTLDNQLTLLSASADNSLAMWAADPLSGVWVCQTRLGEISSQKGSTTATGSTGGLWIGLWQPDGQGVVSLGRTGSWRRWAYEPQSDTWVQRVGVSGHTKEVQGLAWSRDGTYLLSTSSDQTTRLWSAWERDEGRKVTWHEFSRPQIHGYDLNCVDAISSDQFVSGADEKLLRIFNQPKGTADLIHNLFGDGREEKIYSKPASRTTELPEAASIPVLGLSNKAISSAADEPEDQEAAPAAAPTEDQTAANETSNTQKSLQQLTHPPFEEHLARHTLWPEHEKLYGHGYEISALAASRDGTLVATACKASSVDHAVIRLYECHNWREVKPPLTAHNLTVTSLEFSPDDRHLLSVGRDRRWTIFRRSEADPQQYSLLCTEPKGHARMILDCSWAPKSGGEPVFATAGRDKTIKYWRFQGDQAMCAHVHTAEAPVTALAFTDAEECSSDGERRFLRLAYGTEEGHLRILEGMSAEALDRLDEDLAFPRDASAKAVNALAWRPRNIGAAQASTPLKQYLAVARDDNSVVVAGYQPGSHA